MYLDIYTASPFLQLNAPPDSGCISLLLLTLVSELCCCRWELLQVEVQIAQAALYYDLPGFIQVSSGALQKAENTEMHSVTVP